MIHGAALAALVPHAGRMVLLDAVVRWEGGRLLCRSRSHLDPGNPLRRDGRLPAVCGAEYGLQAAALHGAMLAGGVAQRAGYVARLRDVALRVPYLDEAAFGVLGVEAVLEHSEAGGMVYALVVSGNDGRALVTCRASIALPGAGA